MVPPAKEDRARVMVAPFDRNALRRRNRLDLAEAVALARDRAPADRIRTYLEIADFCLRLASAGGVDTAGLEQARFADKVRRLARPLHLLEDK